MKERIVHKTAKHKLLIVLLFSCIAFICFSYKTNAQGWTFTFKMQATGFCPNSAETVAWVNSILPQINTLGIPTKSQCESLRQSVSSINVSAYLCDNGDPVKCGYCYLSYVCTPCTGSDIATTGLVNPGDVSFDYLFEGKPFFTTHQSEAFKDWATEYKQLLASYGITSILGKKIIPHQIPLTGDKNFDDFYNNQTANFNPTTTTFDTIPNQDPNVVDSSDWKGVVQLLTTKEEQAKRDKWYKEQGFDKLTQMDPNNPAISEGTTNGLINELIIEKIKKKIQEELVKIVPRADLIIKYKKFVIKLASLTFNNLEPAVNANVGIGSPNSVMNHEEIVGKASEEWLR